MANNRAFVVILAVVAVVSAMFGPAGSILAFACGIALFVLAQGPDLPETSEPDVAAPEPLQAASLAPVYATLTALDTPVFVLDRAALVLFQNPAAVRSFNAMQAGSHVSARLRSPGLLDMIRETIATGKANQIEHFERFPADTVYLARIAPAGLDANVAPVFILSFRDISETRRIDRMRTDFVANASHELRTPLASLRGFIETLQGPAKSDAKAQERFLGIMLEQVMRMTRLVDDLLSLSRLELKSQLAPLEEVDLVPLLGHVSDSLSPLASDLNVEIRLSVPETAVNVSGDRDELTEVFENLIENACKYGQDGKFVDVLVQRGPDGSPEVVITDFGPGIPEEHLPRITERFYRVNVENSRSKKGTGLGLAIVKHILTRHRARLLVKSEVGKGSVFTVRF